MLYKTIIDQAEITFFEFRSINFSSLFDELKIYQDGDFSKINKRVLTKRKWHQLQINLDDKCLISLNKRCGNFDYSPSKYIKSLVGLFLNQGNFFDRETKSLQGFFNKSLCLIKINAHQIARNKKENANSNEILIAHEIIKYTNLLLNKLKDDPILYSGRKFDNLRLQTTLQHLKLNFK